MADTNFEFVCTSGLLLWGPLQCIATGYKNRSKYADKLTKTEKSDFKFVVNARVGKWLTSRVYIHSKSDPDVEDVLLGYFIHHESIDPSNLLENFNAYGYKDEKTKRKHNMVAVGRYDWILDDDGDKKRELCEKYFEHLGILERGHFVMIDADMFGTYCENQSETFDSCQLGNYGVLLTVDDTEYERGWMYFDPKQKDKLIGFFYDANYSFTQPTEYLDDLDDDFPDPVLIIK